MIFMRSKALHPAAADLDHMEEVPAAAETVAAQARCYGWPQYFRSVDNRNSVRINLEVYRKWIL